MGSVHSKSPPSSNYNNDSISNNSNNADEKGVNNTGRITAEENSALVAASPKSVSGLQPAIATRGDNQTLVGFSPARIMTSNRNTWNIGGSQNRVVIQTGPVRTDRQHHDENVVNNNSFNGACATPSANNSTATAGDSKVDDIGEDDGEKITAVDVEFENGLVVVPSEIFDPSGKYSRRHLLKWRKYFPYLTEDKEVRQKMAKRTPGEEEYTVDFTPEVEESFRDTLNNILSRAHTSGRNCLANHIRNSFQDAGFVYKGDRHPQNSFNCRNIVTSLAAKKLCDKMGDPLFFLRFLRDNVHVTGNEKNPFVTSKLIPTLQYEFNNGNPKFAFHETVNNPKLTRAGKQSRKGRVQHFLVKTAQEGAQHERRLMKDAEWRAFKMSYRASGSKENTKDDCWLIRFDFDPSKKDEKQNKHYLMLDKALCTIRYQDSSGTLKERAPTQKELVSRLQNDPVKTIACQLAHAVVKGDYPSSVEDPVKYAMQCFKVAYQHMTTPTDGDRVIKPGVDDAFAKDEIIRHRAFTDDESNDLLKGSMIPTPFRNLGGDGAANFKPQHPVMTGQQNLGAPHMMMANQQQYQAPFSQNIGGASHMMMMANQPNQQQHQQDSSRQNPQQPFSQNIGGASHMMMMANQPNQQQHQQDSSRQNPQQQNQDWESEMLTDDELEKLMEDLPEAQGGNKNDNRESEKGEDKEECVIENFVDENGNPVSTSFDIQDTSLSQTSLQLPYEPYARNKIWVFLKS